MRASMDLLEKVRQTIEKHHLLASGEPVLAAVSGGPDSLSMTHCLVRLGYPVTAAHFDHGLRTESGGDASWVGEWARAAGIPVVIWRASPPLEPSGHNLEASARQARYRFLCETARARGIGKIATGHTADDQVETVLLHLLRGAGPEGLQGMLPSRSLADLGLAPAGSRLHLVRPLLEASRARVMDYVHSVGLQPRDDASNRDGRFARNRLRHDLLPALEAAFPGTKPALLRLGRLMGAQAEWLDEAVATAAPATLRGAGDRAVAIERQPFSGHPRAVRWAVLRRALQACLAAGGDEIGLADIERAEAAILSGDSGHRISLSGGLEVIPVGQEVVIRPAGAAIQLPGYPQLDQAQGGRLKVPGSIRLLNGWAIHGSLQPISAEWLQQAGRSGCLAAFDPPALSAGLQVRAGRPGDRIQPFGMKGRVKLSDLFINCGVPQPARRLWPVVCSGERIVWVPGLRSAETGRLKHGPDPAVVLQLESPAGKRWP
jgi:tRNA(Ile)-lysidine synthetase-like protein